MILVIINSSICSVFFYMCLSFIMFPFIVLQKEIAQTCSYKRNIFKEHTNGCLQSVLNFEKMCYEAHTCAQPVSKVCFIMLRWIAILQNTNSPAEPPFSSLCVSWRALTQMFTAILLCFSLLHLPTLSEAISLAFKLHVCSVVPFQ